MMARAKAKAAAAAADKTAGEMKAKASELDEKHGVSAAAGAKAEQAKAKAGEMKKAAKIKAHGKVAELFYEYDADDSGWLDQEEVLAFCGSLGLKFSGKEARQALDEMEVDGTRDGRVSLDEFIDWWQSETATKKKGSIAGRLAEARDAAYKAELDGGR